MSKRSLRIALIGQGFMGKTHFNAYRVHGHSRSARGAGPRRLLVTDAERPHAGSFRKLGHILGYEHTFIATLAGFLHDATRGETAHLDFHDALRTQTVFYAAERSAESGTWQQVADPEAWS